MNAVELYYQAVGRGYRLETDGRDLLVFGKRDDTLPPELVVELRQHKRELLDWLDHHTAGLRRDEIPWLHVARQILAGEFDGLLDSSTRESLTIGLRSIPHPLCRRALERLGVSD